MPLKLTGAILCVIQLTVLLSPLASANEPAAAAAAATAAARPTGDNEVARTSGGHDDKPKVASIQQAGAPGLEARLSGDRNFVKDIVDRLHALDADIGKLLFNSTSMYAPNDQTIAQQEGGGGEKFTEVLNDLDSLQDEIGVLINNATRTRQYNILVRLRPLNNLLYRIRHNLHLMRNSLVAINAVSSLEKIGNSVLDSTLQAFMRPDANLSEEIGDEGNYEINLDKLEAAGNNNASTSSPATSTTALSTTPTTTTSTTTTSTTTTSTTPPPPPAPSSPATTAAPATSGTPKLSTSRPGQRNATRRANNRQSQRRTPKPSTPKPDRVVSH